MLLYGAGNKCLDLPAVGLQMIFLSPFVVCHLQYTPPIPAGLETAGMEMYPR